MTHDKENLISISYDRAGEVTYDDSSFDPTLPTRTPDYIQVDDVTRAHNGEYTNANHFWFKEGRMANISNYYDDDTKESTLRRTVHPGVTNLCPNSGHLMFINNQTYEGWEFARKDTQDAFVGWLTEQTLLQPDSDTN